MLTTKSRLLISSIIAMIALVIIASGIPKNKSNNNSLFYLSNKYYNNGEIIKVDEVELDKISNETFLLFIYNNICENDKSCEEEFDDVLKRNKLDYISISIDDFKNTKYYDKVKNAPSFMIIKNSNIVAYLDSENNNDLDTLKDEKSFEKWLSNYIYIKK